MNRKARIVAAIVGVIGLGGAATALSWARAQQAPRDTAPRDDHRHVGEDHDQTDSHKNSREKAGHDSGDRDEHDDHEGHDAHGDHEGHGEHAEHDEHSEESVVRLGAEERKRFGVEVAVAGTGRLTTYIRLPGEIVLNADRVAHIVPRAPGIVREVLARVGDAVHAGDVMAWIESAELGEAKVDYLAKWAELGCGTVDLARAQEVHDNTLHLLEVLNSSPSLEELLEMSGGAMGDNRGILVSAYAESVFAKAAYLREGPLFEKKIASERDYQAAEAEYKKANALYAATRDSIDFNVRRSLLEAKRTQQVTDIELKGAKRRLYVFGLTSGEIAELGLLRQLQTPSGAPKTKCPFPDCAGCKQAGSRTGNPVSLNLREVEEKLAWYPLRAPFDGTVIEKHLTLGEKHSDDSGAFTVADLSSVWVDIAVYQKDLAYVKKGMNIRVSMGAGMASTDGMIAYIAPVVDEETRTTLARVVLPNTNGEWRPGLFVSAEITIGGENALVVIPKSAIQRMGEQTVVFLDTSDGFTPAPVSLGRSSGSRVEVLSGLAVGQHYVAQGAFELKAKIITSGLGAHAGHGH